MVNAIITPDQDAIVAEIEVSAPIERVFSALTDPRQLINWWGDARCRASVWEMDARLGGKWRFVSSDPTGRMVINGVREFKCHGEIVEYDPPRLLAYTWFANWHEHPEVPATARWELTATKTGTHVKATHSGLYNEPTARKDYAGGWPGVLEMLRKHLEKN